MHCNSPNSEKHQKAKPLRGAGSGVFEIAARYNTNTYRAVYTVKLGENIYVLHVFQKKSTRGISTPKKEIDLIKQRLRMARKMGQKMSEKIKVEESSGNVFLDMGFSEEEAEREQLRSYLAYHVHSLFEELKLTPAKAKTHFGIEADDVSRIQEGDFHLFTVPQLLLLLKRLKRNIEIRITPSDEKVGRVQVIAT